MSIPRPSDLHPDHWVEKQVATGKARLNDCRAELETVIVRKPIEAVAIAAAAGYLIRSLPLARVVSSSIRLTLPFVPHLLLAIGAARAWEFLQADPDRLRRTPRFRSSQHDERIAICDKLLRGELSAIESYTQALVKFGNHDDKKPLEQILASHENSASRLRQHIAEMGGMPSVSSGMWGDFATALESSAAMLGESPALAVLQAGEEHGIRQYEEALNDPRVTEDFKTVIRQHLLPTVQENVLTLLQIKVM
jgi:demethoxyubiquinone hydroxylase (CLK1/Coq7/Cat5 family)